MNGSGDIQEKIGMACWELDIPAIADAIAGGARVNEKDGHDYVWTWTLRLNAARKDKQRQFETFCFLMKNGLTLNGGGKDYSGESLLARLERMDAKFSQAFVAHHGAKAVRRRIDRRTASDLLNLDFWDDAITLHEQKTLSANTRQAPRQDSPKRRL